MRDRDSSLGSHVLSQFAVSPRSFFAPLSSGSTISSPLRHTVFLPLASSSRFVPWFTWCGNITSPTNILCKNVHEDAPSRVKRRVHLDARRLFVLSDCVSYASPSQVNLPMPNLTGNVYFFFCIFLK